MGVFLGFDTSNYTTSVAAADENGNIIANVKKLLPVKDGERGLRQSDAVFHHTNALPDILDEVKALIGGEKIIAVGASERPRDAVGSYMPCFLVGRAAAKSAALSAGVPYYDFSHQCGHVMAALYSAKKTELVGQDFVAFHLSGGTTDILLVESDKERIIKATRIGGTKDINAGQAIDRAGVMAGLHFPCGAELEKYALAYDGQVKVKICVDGLDCNLSGVENKAKELYEKSKSREAVAATVFEYVSKTVKTLTENVLEKYPDIPIIYSGGVASSVILKNTLAEYGSFAEPKFSSDNAAGTALLTAQKYRNNGL